MSYQNALSYGVNDAERELALADVLAEDLLLHVLREKITQSKTSLTLKYSSKFDQVPILTARVHV